LNLKEVAFNGTKYHKIKKDDNTDYYTNDPANNPHWTDGGNKYPVCFTRNTKMKVVNVKITAEPESVFKGNVQIKGDGPENLNFSSTRATVNTTVSGTELKITNVDCSNAFKNEIDFFDPLKIKWQVSPDNGKTWLCAGASRNQAYITLGDPTTGTTVYHTLAHLGCKNAEGETQPAQATTKIWGEFTDCKVYRVDRTQLTYYASYKTDNVTTASLLENGDGQCGSWAKLFIDVLKVQGIDNTNDYYIFEPNAADVLLVKDWNFAGAGTSGVAGYPYLNISYMTPPDLYFDWDLMEGATSYNWVKPEVTDAPGIEGQGNNNPASIFGNHQIVQIGTTLYDPSYGKTFSSLADIDNQAMAGYFVIRRRQFDESVLNADINHDGDKNDILEADYLAIQENPAGNDLVRDTSYTNY
jgi:hypothetical protein